MTNDCFIYRGKKVVHRVPNFLFIFGAGFVQRQSNVTKRGLTMAAHRCIEHWRGHPPSGGLDPLGRQEC